MSAQQKIAIYNQHCRGILFTCPFCNESHIGRPQIHNLDDDSDELPQVFCTYGCGYIFLPIIKTNRR